MGLISSADKKNDKLKLVTLQNIIFNSKETKLMVTPEFLKEMSDRYVGKRLTNVNKNIQNMSNTKSPEKYFAYSDLVDSNLDELCQLEPYYNFKKPTPSEFRESMLSSREHSISTMFNRAWKYLLNKTHTSDGVPDNTVPFEELINEIMNFKDRLTKVNINQIDLYKKSLCRISKDDDTAGMVDVADDEFADNNDLMMDMDFDNI